MTSSKTPKISIIMVDGLFRERFESIDFMGSQTLSPDCYELLWCEYYDHISPELEAKLSKYPNFRAITLGKEGTYHSSCCFNAGIEASQGNILVIPDADVIAEPNFLESILESHQDPNSPVTYCYRFDEPQEEHREFPELEHLRSTCVLNSPMNFGACLTARKECLLDVNGYDTHAVFQGGFHAVGRDVFTRLKVAGYSFRFHPTIRLFHPWHSMTGHGQLQWELQGLVIEARARHLLKYPFQGLHPEHDSEMPKWLERTLDDFQRENSETTSIWKRGLQLFQGNA